MGEGARVSYSVLFPGVTVEPGAVVEYAILGEGCRIGRGAVVAAGAVVISDVPPDTVVAGCPARILKRKDETSAAKTALVDALREL